MSMTRETPVGHLLGDTLRPARRLPVDTVAHLDAWGVPFPDGSTGP